MRPYILIALASLLADRILKGLALGGAEWSAAGFRFRLLENDQLVFSLPTGAPAALVIMAAGTLLIGWLLVRAWRRSRTTLAAAALLMFTGAMSNLYDRLAYGFVIDWADFGPRWPVFNLADVIVLIGVAWYVWPARRLTKSTG